MRAAPLALALALAGCASASPVVSSRCSHPVADLHVNLPFQVHYRGRPRNLSRPGGDVTTTSLQAGCVELVVLPLFLPMGLRPRPLSPAELAAVLNTAEATVTANPQLSRTGGPGTRVVFSLEGSQAIATQHDAIPHLVSRGVVLFGLVHIHHNELADSSSDPHPKRGGLTPTGERFVEAVYRAGALVDLSHASDDTFADVAAIAARWNRPLVASHSNARAITPHHRNLTDEQLRAIAASGGVVGLTFHSPFLRQDRQQATADDVARHARHMIAVMGPNHVAIGSDLDGLIHHAKGLETHRGMASLIEALRRHGISGRMLQALLRDNVRRVLLPLPAQIG